MEVNWRDMEHYLSAPGTGDKMTYTDGCFVTDAGDRRFSIHEHIVDFMGETNNNDSASTSQSEYWESPEPVIRPPGHPVQIQFAEQRFKYLDRLIQFEDVQSALDIGCGNGVGTVSLRRRVDVAFGLDMSAHLLNQMPDDIIGIRADSASLPLRDKSVDLSMCWEMIHHVPDPLPVFREMCRVTRKWVVLFEPNRWNPLQAGFALVMPQERLVLRRSRSFLIKTMEQAGLKVVHYATVGCIFPNKSPIWLARVLKLMPFRIPWLGISNLLIAEVG